MAPCVERQIERERRAARITRRVAELRARREPVRPVLSWLGGDMDYTPAPQDSEVRGW